MTKELLANEAYFEELRKLLHDGSRVVIPVKGRSMLPFIHEGSDKVVLAPPSTLNEGDIVLARLSDGSYILHRIFTMDASHLTLMGDGNVYGQESCSRDEVLGKVIEIHRGEKVIDCLSPKERRKARWWKRLLPLRRYLLFIYRQFYSPAHTH